MLEYEPPSRQAVAISMPVTSGSSRAPMAAATMFVSVRMATLTATGFPQLFWNERQRERLAARSTHRSRGEKQASRSQKHCKRRDYAQCEENVVAFLSAGRDGSDNIRMSKSSFSVLHMVARKGLTDSQHKSRAPAALRRWLAPRRM